MLLVEKPSDGVAVVTLNRPEAMNALSKALRAALQQANVELDADPEVRVIVLTGAGERAFTAGLDHKELSTDPLGMGAANATDPAENPARAVLASPRYRAEHDEALRIDYPRIPWPADAASFERLLKVGRLLAELYCTAAGADEARARMLETHDLIRSIDD